MKTFVAITLFASMVLGLAGPPAHRDFPSARQGTSASEPGSARSDAAANKATILAVETSRANEILSELKQQYQGLDGVTVRMGTTPKREQAVAYYTLDEIVISPTHTASLDEILAHEVWHIIDWRDNGRLDWGENLPPANPGKYLNS